MAAAAPMSAAWCGCGIMPGGAWSGMPPTEARPLPVPGRTPGTAEEEDERFLGAGERERRAIFGSRRFEKKLVNFKP